MEDHLFIDHLGKIVRSGNTSKILIPSVVAGMILILLFSTEYATAKVNQPPVANPVTATTNAGTPTDITIVPTFASDPDGDTVTVTGVSPTTIQGGTVSINLDGKSVHYIPPLNFVGVDTFVYIVTDTAGLTASNTVNIIDGNGEPSISINDISAPDGSSGTTPFVFTVSLSAASGQTITVNYATADGTATAANNDYTPTSGTVIFPAGTTTQTITVFVIGNTINDADETFFVNLSNPTHAIFGTGNTVITGIGTILNDDLPPTLSISDANPSTGPAGNVNEGATATFVVSLSAPSDQTITVNYATVDGTAKAGIDSTPITGTLIFHPLTTTQPINVNTVRDGYNDPTETFNVDLTNPTNAGTSRTQGTATIINPIPTTTSLLLSQTAPVSGQKVIVTATVADAAGITPPGTVKYNDNGAGGNLGSTTCAPLGNTLVCTAPYTIDKAGPVVITAIYDIQVSPTGNVFDTSNDKITVTFKEPTTTTLSSSANPSTARQAVTFDATIASAISGTPTGTVTFYNGVHSLGVVTLGLDGQALFTTSALPVGSNPITAVYGGDGNFITSTSLPLTQTVNPSLSPEGGSISACEFPTVGVSCPARFAPSFTYGWSLVSAPPGSHATLDSMSSPSPSFTPDLPGCYQVSVMVTDKLGNTASDSMFVPVQVSSCGAQPPSALSGSINPCDNPTVGGACTVVFAPSFTYGWSLVSAPPGSHATLDSMSSQSTSFTPDLPGQYVIQLVVTDSGGFATSFSKTITAFPPLLLSIIQIPTGPIITGDSVTLQSQATSGCTSNPSIEYKWTIVSQPSNSQLTVSDPTAPAITFTPHIAFSYKFALFAHDNTCHSSATSFATVTVITPADGVLNLVKTVNGMNLDPRITNSFVVKLNAVYDSIISGNNNAAVNQLNALINEMNAQTEKKISQIQAAALIPAVQNIINAITNPTPPPTIRSFTPTSGQVGTPVNILGTGFSGTPILVKFGDTSAAFSLVSSTSIRATVPAGATTGPISVTTPTGTATSTTSFTVLPMITSFAPPSGPAGTVVTITGTGFTGITSVKFNGNSALFSLSSSTQIRATVPTGATTGIISVTTLSGTATSTAQFTVIKPPAISSFAPSSGPAGTTVTISGSNFFGVTDVQFNGVSSSFSVLTPATIKAIVPAAATTGIISVTTPAGTGTSITDFVVS